MKLLVYEHVSGGGCAEQPIDPKILCEGFGMLRTVVSDLKAVGHEVTVLLDTRISRLNPPVGSDCVIPISYKKDLEDFLVQASKINDAVYFIAPETGQTLQSFLNLVEQTGKLSLNCEANAISEVSDKTVLYSMLVRNGISVPKTVPLTVESGSKEIYSAINELSFPLVLKPADGVSCSGLSLVKEGAQIEIALSKLRDASSAKSFIAQEFVEGTAVSVTLICSSDKAFALSLNVQNVYLASSDGVSCYEGGAVPLEHPLEQEAFEVAENVAESFSGLRGYVGVDLVLTKDKPYVVDVNPRLTTSYVGLSKVLSFNVAEALVRAVLENKLPSKPTFNGVSYFSKVETPKPTQPIFHKVTQINEVVSPPFPLNTNLKACSLVAAQGESLTDAKLHFAEAKKRLLNIFSGGN